MRSQRPYDILFSLPIFTGMSREEMDKVVARARFDYHKLAAGEVVARQGDPCGQLFLLISGTLKSTIKAHHYAVTEWINAPAVLEQWHVFGLTQRFSRTYVAETQASYITLDKNGIQKIAGDSFIFRSNIINALSTNLQKQELRLWSPPPSSLAARIIFFMAAHALTPVGRKEFKIKMTDLAQIVNDSRLDVSRALNALQDKGLLSLSRGKIVIPDMKGLTQTT